MRMVDIIEKKRDGFSLSKEEITFFIKGYTNGSIPDYQASALAMAIVLNGMDKEEIGDLTDAMMHSGEIIDLTSIKGMKVDKHSTGGVGDKTSLVLGPLVASCGAKLAKMSGRGLGHTGGTLDKMESIPGMRINLSEEEFIEQVNKIGMAIIGQTVKIDPADKKLYALRDVTATVESIPLISSSIMSKKLASGSDSILLDVKFGSGAFMKTIEKAKELARTMVDIGAYLNKDTRAIITDMEEPLGMAIGNALEVKEAISTLRGNGPKDLVDLVTYAGAIMLEQAKIVNSLEEGKRKIKQAIEDGSGFNKLLEFISAQGGDVSYIKDPSKFKLAKNIVPIYSISSGYVGKIDSLLIGVSAMKLGAGRETLNDTIDMSAGIILNKKVGDFVNKGDIICYLHTNKDDYASISKDVLSAFSLAANPVKIHPIVYDYIK
ncbi:MAG TPA: pyrimidine-nucleoside phosphorylase [Firmicutes bacterium]|nr:pyrimidine-nucleoside phosphorylase [Bacillota bacterium]